MEDGAPAVEIRPGLFMGGRAAGTAACQASSTFTRVLALGCPLEGSGGAGAPERLGFDELMDEEDSDLLEIVEECVAFVGEGLRGGGAGDEDGEGAARGKVLVHCEAGRSRSAAVICAHLMKSEGLSAESAGGGRGGGGGGARTLQLEVMQAALPEAQPNDGFAEQLRLYGSMGCTLDATRPAYKYHKAQQLAIKREKEGWLDVGILSNLPGVTGEGGGADGQMFRCRKCRKLVATSANEFPHTPGVGPAAFKYRKRGGGGGGECTSVFLEPLSWMLGCGVAEGMHEGKLNCVCSARLGSFNWAGEQCSCGAWVVPAFQLNKAKLDIIRALPPPTTMAKPRVLP